MFCKFSRCVQTRDISCSGHRSLPTTAGQFPTPLVHAELFSATSKSNIGLTLIYLPTYQWCKIDNNRQNARVINFTHCTGYTESRLFASTLLRTLFLLSMCAS